MTCRICGKELPNGKLYNVCNSQSCAEADQGAKWCSKMYVQCEDYNDFSSFLYWMERYYGPEFKEFLDEVMSIVAHQWYNVYGFKEHVACFMREVKALQNYTPESFIAKFQGELVAYVVIYVWLSRTKNRGFYVPECSRTILLNLAESCELSEIPKSLDDAIKMFHKNLSFHFNEDTNAKNYTAHDEKLLEYAWARLVHQDAYYSKYKNMTIDRRHLLRMKRFTDEEQVSYSIQYIKALVAQLDEENGVMALNEKDNLRMQRFKTLLQSNEVAKQIPRVQMVSLKRVPHVKVTNKGVTMYIGVFGVLELVNGDLKAHISRNPSDSFACFEHVRAPLSRCMELKQAIYFERLIQHAFDLRKKVQ